MRTVFAASRHLLLISAYGFLALSGAAQAQAELPTVTMVKDPFCGCCEAWADHMRAAGFKVDVSTNDDMSQIKAQFGVSEKLASCHTASVAGYVIEGHVPASSVKKLIREKPQAKGLTVPGMPMGSPGMEVAGQPAERYDVLLFNGEATKRFESYQGDKAL